MAEKHPSTRDTWHGGKGSKRRPENNDKYRDGYDRVFGKKEDKEKKDDRGSPPTSVH